MMHGPINIKNKQVNSRSTSRFLYPTKYYPDDKI